MALLIVVVAITTACKSYMLKVRVPSISMLVSCESLEMPAPCHFISLFSLGGCGTCWSTKDEKAVLLWVWSITGIYLEHHEKQTFLVLSTGLYILSYTSSSHTTR